MSERLAGRVDGHLATFAAHMREGLLAASTAVGLEVMAELMDAEVTATAGPKGKPDRDRAAVRHGTEAGSVTLGGRRVPVRRPRVRTVGDDAREVPLESYTTLPATDLLAEGIVARMLARISTRSTGRARTRPRSGRRGRVGHVEVGGVPPFANATVERLAELHARPLGDQRWLVVYLDGFGFGDHTLVGARSVTLDGTKIPLSVIEGSTENAAVCTRLVSDLRPRAGRHRRDPVRRRWREGHRQGRRRRVQ